MNNNKSTLAKAIIAAFGALVVGLNLGGISGAIEMIEGEFALTALAKGFVTGSLMIGCLIGALTGGSMSDRFGRKPMLVASAIMLGLAAAGCWFFAPSAAFLVAYRFIGGLGVGILSAVIPAYITEISPAEKRGTYVSLYQLFVVIGIFGAYAFNWMIGTEGGRWHLMLGLPLFFAVIDIILLLFLDESPVWIESRGLSKEKGASFGELFKGRIGWVVFLGSMLAFFQQITGINVVINYAPGILAKLGIAGSNPLLQTVFIGFANLVFTIIALWLCDKFGRKTLLVTGCAGCFLSLGYLVYAYSIPDPSAAGVLIAILAYIGFFALSLSPLMFVVTSEMYPSYIRGTAMSLSTGISWACAFIVVQFYPWMEQTLGTNIAFAIFAVLCLIAGLFIQFLIPETKGKSLEQIQKELRLE